jgi:hypothetical protein
MEPHWSLTSGLPQPAPLGESQKFGGITSDGASLGGGDSLEGSSVGGNSGQQPSPFGPSQAGGCAGGIVIEVSAVGGPGVVISSVGGPGVVIFFIHTFPLTLAVRKTTADTKIKANFPKFIIKTITSLLSSSS